MRTKSPRSEYFLAMRGAPDFSLKNVQQFISQVLLVQKFDEQICNIDLDAPLMVSHQSHQKSGDHL